MGLMFHLFELLGRAQHGLFSAFLLMNSSKKKSRSLVLVAVMFAIKWLQVRMRSQQTAETEKKDDD